MASVTERLSAAQDLGQGSKSESLSDATRTVVLCDGKAEAGMAVGHNLLDEFQAWMLMSCSYYVQ